MKKVLFLLVIVIVLSYSNILKAKIVLYCQSELGTGFAKTKDSWKEASFELERYTIKFNRFCRYKFCKRKLKLIYISCKWY